MDAVVTEGMPLRRQMLAVVGTAGLSAAAGCTAAVSGIETGYPQLKRISVRWAHHGQHWRERLLTMIFDGSDRLWGQLAAEIQHVLDGPAAVRVDDETHDALDARFETVTYELGICWTDGEQECWNPRVSRDGFNDVQFDDRATVAFPQQVYLLTDEAGAEGPQRAYVLDVERGAHGDPAEWEREVELFSAADQHGERGIPLA